MLQLFRKKDGAVTVFLVIILVPMIVMSCLFVDVSRAKLAGSVVNAAGDLTLNTVLTQYDATLDDYYGLLASSQSVDEFLANADDYFTACITSQGVEASDARDLADMIIDAIKGEGGEIQDLLQITETEGTKFTVQAAENGTLENPALIKKEIVEFMKYRAPIDGVEEVMERFRASAKDLEDAKDNADLVDKKKKFYDQESELMKQAKKAYDELVAYNNLNITKESIEQMKGDLETVEEEYKKLHIKMVKDLYNTQNVSEYKKIDLSETYAVSESDVNASQVNGYINNAAEAIRDYIVAETALNNACQTLGYSSSMYDIQYWVLCDGVLKQNKVYSKYASKAATLRGNMAKLDMVMSLLSEEEQGKNYTLAAYDGVEVSGTATRKELYDGLTEQFSDLKTDNHKSDYYSLLAKLENIADENRQNIDPDETNQKIGEIQRKFEDYYTKYDDAETCIETAVKALRKVKSEAEDYQKKFETWKNAANTYDTTLAKSDQEEITNLDDDIYENVTPENIQELIDRLNNIKSLFGKLKKGIDEYKYNGTKVRSIPTYDKMKEKSGVSESKISVYTNELNSYADSSFRFNRSETLSKTGITDNNNPAIDSVNTPKFYNWLKEKFKDYDQDSYDQAEKDKNDKEKDCKGDVDNADKANTDSGPEIKDISDKPSEQYAAAKKEGQVSTDVSQVAQTVSGLFTNFGSTMAQAAVNMRDDLYTMDYIVNMFSYDTFENEAKYKLCSGDVTLENYTSKYADADKYWKSEEVTYTENKTLTNKMINDTNNYSYGNEVEYILYGGSNKQNKTSAYGTIFAIRFALNLVPEFQLHWNAANQKEVSKLLDEFAIAIYQGTSGIIPKPLTKMVLILGLTAGESAKDLKYLKSGMPVELVKKIDDVEVTFSLDSLDNNTLVHNRTKTAFFYSDYLSLILFLKLSAGDEYAIYARTADVIQANMSNKISADSGFVAKKAVVYYSAEADVQVEPLMLKLPIVTNSTPFVEKSVGRITYKAYRGY